MGQGLESQIGLTIDSSQCKEKNDYYRIFKTLLGGRPEARIGSWVRLTIDSSQHKDKNDYYHNFKTFQGSTWG